MFTPIRHFYFIGFSLAKDVWQSELHIRKLAELIYRCR